MRWGIVEGQIHVLVTSRVWDCVLNKRNWSAYFGSFVMWEFNCTWRFYSSKFTSIYWKVTVADTASLGDVHTLMWYIPKRPDKWLTNDMIKRLCRSCLCVPCWYSPTCSYTQCVQCSTMWYSPICSLLSILLSQPWAKWWPGNLHTLHSTCDQFSKYFGHKWVVEALCANAEHEVYFCNKRLKNLFGRSQIQFCCTTHPRK